MSSNATHHVAAAVAPDQLVNYFSHLSLASTSVKRPGTEIPVKRGLLIEEYRIGKIAEHIVKGAYTFDDLLKDISDTDKQLAIARRRYPKHVLREGYTLDDLHRDTGYTDEQMEGIVNSALRF